MRVCLHLLPNSPFWVKSQADEGKQLLTFNFHSIYHFQLCLEQKRDQAKGRLVEGSRSGKRWQNGSCGGGS